ncbi:efflux RND transporter periplasmic adaptor subunit [Neptunomonas phycophila]|uniref:efflux RND transporter periplasmic adaptor subunit n=1 Tax=Neptunomonas phycophila TaxID=1572645 RepID=UPI000948DE4E|nr:efflux RND transporter periplasmic adaptor subunit [Neptunomonas phycophila]
MRKQHALVAVLLSCLASLSYAQESQVRGQLTALNMTQLAAPIAGRVIELKKRAGEEVKAGDLLASFDCRSIKAEENVASARLSAANTKYKVNKRLAKYDNVSSLDVELSRADVVEANAALKLVRVRLDDCNVNAPFDAEVISRDVNLHQHVSVGDPLFGLVSKADMEIEAVIPAKWLSYVKAGTSVTFTSDTTGEQVQGEIARIIDNVDPVSQTLKVIATPTLPDEHAFKPGMSGVVNFANDNLAVAAGAE